MPCRPSVSTVLAMRDDTGLAATAMIGHDGHRGWVYYLAVAEPMVAVLRDLTVQETMVLVPLALITLWMGIHPSSFTRVFDPTVHVLAQAYAVPHAAPQQAALSTP